jgi:hypothetical protein
MSTLNTSDKAELLRWALALSDGLRAASSSLPPLITSLGDGVPAEKLRNIADDDPVALPLTIAALRALDLANALTACISANTDLMERLAADPAAVALYRSRAVGESPARPLRLVK